MMREQDHNRKSELLLQAIGELPDEMIAQAAPQNLPFTKHRGAKLLRPQMFPAAAMVGIGIGLCLLAHHYTSQNNGDPNATPNLLPNAILLIAGTNPLESSTYAETTAPDWIAACIPA